MTPAEPDRPLPPPRVVRVPVSAVRPSPTAFAKAVWNFASGATGSRFTQRFRRAQQDPEHDVAQGIDAMSFAPVALRETGAAYLFDEAGVRLEGSRELAFALTWTEVGRVALQVQHSSFLGLRMLRLVIWPAHPQTFAAAHPECAPAWDAGLGACTVAVVTAPRIPQESIDLVKAGLAFAGERFDGEVETVGTHG